MKWIIGVVGGVVLGVVFGAGFLTGRSFPAHHYEKLDGAVLFDTSTGHMCSVRGDQPAPVAASASLPPDPNDPYAKYIVKPADPNAGFGSAWTAPAPPKNPLPACNAQ